MRGQHLGGLVAYLPDAQCADEPPQVVFLTLFNGGQHIGGGFFPHTVQLRDILSLQVIQISGSFDKAAVHQRLDHRRPHAVNIHGTAAGKMGQVPQQLGRALRTGTANGRTVLVPTHRRAAHGTDKGQIVRYRAGGALVLHHLHDLRNDLPCLLDDNGIADTNILRRDEILIVQRGIGDRSTCQTNRLKDRLWSQDSRAANLYHDILQHRGLALRRVLIGHCPSGTFCGTAQHFTLRQAVQLDHRAVNIKGERHALVPQASDLIENILRALQRFVGDHFEMLIGQIVQCLRVGSERPALCQLQIKNGDVQPPGCGDFGVQLPQRAGSSIAGIGHQRFAFDFPLGVDLLEHAAGHIDLAPNDQMGQLLRQGHGDGADSTQVLCHVLPYPTVTAGSAANKHAVPVLQCH